MLRQSEIPASDLWRESMRSLFPKPPGYWYREAEISVIPDSHGRPGAWREPYGPGTRVRVPPRRKTATMRIFVYLTYRACWRIR